VTTAGEDGTVRLWDVEVAVERGDDATSLNVNGGQKQVAVLKDRRGIKTGCTAVAWQPDGQVRVRVSLTLTLTLTLTRSCSRPTPRLAGSHRAPTCAPR